MRLLQVRVRRQLTVFLLSSLFRVGPGFCCVVETHPYPKSQYSSLVFEIGIAVSDMFVWRGLALALGGGWQLCCLSPDADKARFGALLTWGRMNNAIPRIITTL